MFHVQCEELRINHLTPFLVVTMPYACWFLWRAYYIEDFKWRFHFQFGVALLFWERYILKGQIAFQGHWRLQSWTLNTVHVNRETQPPQEIILEVSPQLYVLSSRSSISIHHWIHHGTRLSNWYKCNARSDTSNCSLNNFSFIISCQQQEIREAQMIKNGLWHISGHKILGPTKDRHHPL
jgi:hypothetical protein